MTHSYQTTITSNLVPWHGMTPQEAYMRGVMDEQASSRARDDDRQSARIRAVRQAMQKGQSDAG